MLGCCLAAAVAAQEPTCIDYGEQPQPLSVLPLAAGDAAGIAVLAHTAYVLIGGVGFAVVDWTDPTAPHVAATVGLAGGGRSLAIGSGALYAIDGAGQLQVCDLADPLAPVPVGPVAGAAAAIDVCVAGETAYLVLASGGLQVVDVTVPLVPVAGLQLPLADGNRGLAVFEGRAYVAGIGHLDHDFGAFHVVDLADPDGPVPLGYYATDGTGFGWSDRYFDVSAGPGGIFVVHEDSWYDWDTGTTYTYTYLSAFDCTDPHAPMPAPPPGVQGREALAAARVGDLIVAAARESGVQSSCPDCSYDHSHLLVQSCASAHDDPPLFDLPLPGQPHGVVWSDDCIMVACGGAGLAIFAAPMLDPELSDPLEPVYPRSWVSGRCAALAGDRLAVAQHHEGGCSPGDVTYSILSLYQLGGGSEPEPQSMWGCDYCGPFQHLVFAGEDLLCADGLVFSLAGGDVIQAGTIPGGWVHATDVALGYLVGAQVSSLSSWDLSDPASPMVAGQLSLGGVADLSAWGNHVYVVTDSALGIVQVAPDGSLTQVGRTALSCTPRAVACKGTRLAVGGSAGELLIYEVTGGVDLTLLTELNLGGRIQDLELGTQLYAAVEGAGWAVVGVSGETDLSFQGWIEAPAARQVEADGDRLLLVNSCPQKVWLTRQACADLVAVPDPQTVPTAGLVRIEDAWPNPANPRLSVAFLLARPATVRAEVIDLAGRHVADLAAGPREAGRHVLRWDGRTDAGWEAASGAYLIRVHAGKDSAAHKVLLVR